MDTMVVYVQLLIMEGIILQSKICEFFFLSKVILGLVQKNAELHLCQTIIKL